MKSKSGVKYPKGFEVLANFVKLDCCIMYRWSSRFGTWGELVTPHTVYLRKCGDRTGYAVYYNVLWNIEMRDDGGAYMVSCADVSVLQKAS